MKIHIVSHTHWDREWYRPFQYFKVKLSYFFDKLFDIFENDDDFQHFMLDGQMVMIEDYLNLKPKNKQRIKQLVKRGKLIIGPWYSQPDEFAPDGEFLIRNLLIGINMAKEYGEYMNVGYLPDSFGQSSQMPHILSGCNIKSVCAMRGMPMHKLNRTEFIWRGLNGDEVLTVALAEGYSNGMFLPKQKHLIDMRIKKALHDLDKRGNKQNMLIMNGIDHQLPQKQISEYIKSKEKSKNQYIHSTLEKYIQDVADEHDDLMCIEGELIYPVTNRVHTSIASTRMYQKKMNIKMQTLLKNNVEPLCTLAWTLGADYPQEIINSAFKEMFKNQSHDSICGCCTDEVHREIDQRFIDVKNMGITLQKMHSRAIAANIGEEKLALVVFNDSMIKGKKIVYAQIYCDKDKFILTDDAGNEIDYVIESREKIDAAALSIWSLYLDTPCIVNKYDISFEVDFDFNYGYKKFNIAVGKQPVNNTLYHKTNTKVMENKFSVISINNDGTFNLYDKQSKKNYYNLNTIEDCGDEGDTYNYSPVENDIVITNESVKSCHVNIEQCSNKQVAVLTYSMKVPKELSADGKNRSHIMVPMKIETQVTSYTNIKRIDVKTKIINTAKEHRIRAIFPTDIKSSYSFAETQFGTIKRTNIIEDAELFKQRKWAEKPLPIYSQQKFVAVNDGEFGLAVLNRGLTEYEIYERGEGVSIAVTLLRGVGYMGKADLAIRQGRPSGVPVATPDAQCLGENISEYSLYAHTGDVDQAQIPMHATVYNAPCTAVQSEIKLKEIAKKHGAMINLFDMERLQHCPQNKLINVSKNDFSFIKIDSDKLIISALKKAENEDAIILRIYNSCKESAESAKIHINAEINKVYECDFLEQNTDEIIHAEQSFNTNCIKGYSAQTYKIYL